MAKIKITIEDDFGNIIGETEQREYHLDLGKSRLDEIEAAVDRFKNRALPDIEEELLQAAQKRFVAGEKKERNTNVMEQDQ